MSRQGWIPDVDHVHAIEHEAGRLVERARALARRLGETRLRGPGSPDRSGERESAALVAAAAQALERLGSRLRLAFFWGKPSLHRMVMLRNVALLLAAARAAARAEAEVPGLGDPELGELARDAVGLAGRLLETVPGWKNRRLVRLGRRLARHGEAPGPGGVAALALAEKAVARIADLEPCFPLRPGHDDDPGAGASSEPSAPGGGKALGDREGGLATA